jgi:hypothetical protein
MVRKFGWRGCLEKYQKRITFKLIEVKL